MMRRQIIKGYKLDSKTLKALLRKKRNVCIHSKKIDAPHKCHLPLPKTAWVNFSVHLSAAFDRPSLYLKTNDQEYDKIKEWFKNEIGLLRGRDNSNYEIVLFSDMGEANSRKVFDICREDGVVKQRTGGYTPEHNAFAERWFCTKVKMLTCQMLQFDLPENMREDSRRMVTFIYKQSSTHTSDSGGGVVITPREAVPNKKDHGYIKATTIRNTIPGLSEETDS
jgi:hypothetical protein